MSKIIICTALLISCKLLLAQTSIFNISANSILQYSGESEKDNIKINITKPVYGKGASYSFTDNISYEKKGKITISIKDITNATRMATMPEMIIKESEKFSDIGSAIWMSNTKFDTVLKHSIYIDYDIAESKGERIPFNTTYKAKRIRQVIILNGKSTLVEAIQLTSDTLRSENLKGVLQFTIQNNKSNPILLYSSSKMWIPNETKTEEITVFQLWLKSANKVLMRN